MLKNVKKFWILLNYSSIIHIFTRMILDFYSDDFRLFTYFYNSFICHVHGFGV
jgi:hypothetical protein